MALYFVYCCHGDIHFTKNCTLANFNSWSVSSENLIANDKEKIMFKVTENTGVAAEKLYGNTLKGIPPSLY